MNQRYKFGQQSEAGMDLDWGVQIASSLELN